MRIPNLNVTQSITQQIKDLDAQRLKLDQQISSGQKIKYAEDDGSMMSRTIRLDSQKSRLSQYQRNASYASEFLNAGHLNLEKLHEINQRAQEIARVAGGGLSGSGIDTYSLELDQLIDETLNRLNSSHRGKKLFGGLELKPDFAHSDVISEEAELKILDLNNSSIGSPGPNESRYLKQGDEVVFLANGREYVVQAKMPEISDHIASENYNKGDLVKVTDFTDDAILIDGAEFSDLDDVLSKLSDKDWSKTKAGDLRDKSAQVFLLDAAQIEQIAVSLGNQPNIDFLPSSGGYFAISKRDDDLFLEPVQNSVDKWQPNKNYSAGDLVQWGFEFFQASTDIQAGEDFSESNWGKITDETASNSFILTEQKSVSYWEAANDGIIGGQPSIENNSWVQINPNEFLSNVSTSTATDLLRDLINSDAYHLSNSKVFESVDSFAFVRNPSSSRERHDSELSLSASVNTAGQLVVKGTVGKSFVSTAGYISKYDSNNYFPEQLDSMVEAKAKSMFPNQVYEALSDEDRNKVWESVKQDKLHWDIGVQSTVSASGSEIEIALAEPWKRLGIFQLGDVVEYNGKLWESTQNENFNHEPNFVGSEFWRELGSDYNQKREDWVIRSSGIEARFYFSSPDGKLFNDRAEAVNYTYELLSNSTRSYTDLGELFQDAESLVNEIAYPVSRFEASASESNGIVYFDSSSQSYKLASLPLGQSKMDGVFLKGNIMEPSSLDLTKGDVVQYRGSYFIATNILTPEDVNSVIGAEIIKGADVVGDLSSSVAVGEKIYEESTGRVYMLLGNSLPVQGREVVLQNDVVQPLRKGAYLYDPQTEKYFVAQENIEDVNLVEKNDFNSPLIAVNSFSAIQGSEWSSDQKYGKGQIVFHNGIYYECQSDGKVGNDGNFIGFDNKDDEQLLGSDGNYYHPLVSPSDEFFYQSEDAISRESYDLRRARGEEIYNNVWLPVSEMVNHVLSFDVNNIDEASVKIQPAGKAGIDASVKVVTDVNGVVSNLEVENPGRYFFPGAIDNDGNVSIPESYRSAEVILPDGESIVANIIWGENPNDPGPFIITGFELLGTATLDHPMGSQVGDSYSFATGKKTFLDHRDQEGRLLSVSYTGSEEDAEFYVGKDTKISSFLSAQNNGTSELKEVLTSLVDLRNGLSHSDISEMSEAVQLAEKDLIAQEGSVIDKLGELSSLMVRMETVRAYDEEYFLEIDQKLASDLDVDLSEAIMQLTRVSTAYQAAMQVGAQLLNTSLLNYL
jgi:flagellin-like hook-associated protein FlgL